MKSKKYIGIKLASLHFWLWFELEKTEEDTSKGYFLGKDGWGEHGAYIEKFELNNEGITGRIYSDTLQYK